MTTLSGQGPRKLPHKGIHRQTHTTTSVGQDHRELPGDENTRDRGEVTNHKVISCAGRGRAVGCGGFGWLGRHVAADVALAGDDDQRLCTALLGGGEVGPAPSPLLSALAESHKCAPPGNKMAGTFFVKGREGGGRSS